MTRKGTSVFLDTDVPDCVPLQGRLEIIVLVVSLHDPVQVP